MRPWLSLGALGLCLLLWLWGLLLGRPWPVHLVVAPPWSLVAGAGDGPGPQSLLPEGPPGIPRESPPALPLLRLTPPAGAVQVRSHVLPCAPQAVQVLVTRPFASAVGVGWPGAEDGFGVLTARTAGTTATFALRGHGRVAGPRLQLTSYGAAFDGTGTLEVVPQCDAFS